MLEKRTKRWQPPHARQSAPMRIGRQSRTTKLSRPSAFQRPDTGATRDPTCQPDLATTRKSRHLATTATLSLYSHKPSTSMQSNRPHAVQENRKIFEFDLPDIATSDCNQSLVNLTVCKQRAPKRDTLQLRSDLPSCRLHHAQRQECRDCAPHRVARKHDVLSRREQIENRLNVDRLRALYEAPVRRAKAQEALVNELQVLQKGITSVS